VTLSAPAATVIAAILAGATAIGVALYNSGALREFSAADCPPIPATGDAAPPPRDGYIWIPTDFAFVSSQFEEIAGHWQRKRADGKSEYLAGHWETGTGRCVWVKGQLVAGSP
jgi:hypothetical protein